MKKQELSDLARICNGKMNNMGTLWDAILSYVKLALLSKSH